MLKFFPLKIRFSARSVSSRKPPLVRASCSSKEQGGTVKRCVRLEIGNLYVFLFFFFFKINKFKRRSVRLREFIFHFNYIYILLLEKGMANSFEQSHEIIIECNG